MEQDPGLEIQRESLRKITYFQGTNLYSMFLSEKQDIFKKIPTKQYGRFLFILLIQRTNDIHRVERLPLKS